MSKRRVLTYLFLIAFAVALFWFLAGSRLSSQAGAPAETVIAGRNVNMVSGTTLPGGDPWLQRQNEPSIAVSSRNTLHLLAGANDYRTVDMPTSEGELPGKQPMAAVGDAWLGVYMSYDGGESWTSTMLPGFPQDPSANPLKGYKTAADPVVRSGPNGLFYYSGIAFNRDTNVGAVFVARFIDDNNKENGGTIRYIDTKIIAKGTATKFLDKPWISVDQPRAPIGNITVSGQTIPRHSVYIAYSAFSGTTTLLGDIMFARSTDCGASWSTPIKISSGSYAHQGATIAIKPVIGEVLVAWRRFGVPGKTPDAIYVAQSLTRGQRFQSPVKVADVTPFDQPTTDETQALPGTGAGPAFRTNSYPTMAVDKSGHVYLAWSERGRGPAGDARIVLSTSFIGTNWTVPQAVANVDENGLPFLGHQVMPSMTFAAGKLALAWVDQRHDVSSNEYGFNQWIIDSLFASPAFNLRHTMDVWAAEAETADFPNLVWKSSQVSRYLHSLLKDEHGDIVYENGEPVVFPVQFNPVNYPLFKGGHNPFNGDYIDIAASPQFRQDTWRNWIFNADDMRDPVFHVAWTDNRDVRPPLDGNWTVYAPPTSSQASAYISPEHPSCDPAGSGNEPGMRNQNIYTARLTWGIEAGAPVNDKPLNLANGVARAFVVYVKNNTGAFRSFRLTIASQPAGGQASFEQFSLLTSLDVDIAACSTISRPVFINSSDINAAVTINVNETDASGTVLADGLTSFIYINSDTSNPQMSGTAETHNPNIVNAPNPNIVNWFINPNIVNPNIVNPNIVNPNIVNPNIVNPNIVNPNIVNPNIVNPNIVNPNIVNPNIVNPNIVNPNIVNPNIVNPNIVNPNIVNANPDDVAITDVEWTVRNDGSATTSYSLKTMAKKAPPLGVFVQLLVYRIHYTPAVTGAELKAEGVEACSLKEEPHHELVLNVVNPNIVNPNIVNPNIVNPNIVNAEIENATFTLAPGEEVIVDLRVLDSGLAETQSQPMMAMDDEVMGAQALTVLEFIQSLGFAVTSHAVNSVDVALGRRVPPAAATGLVIGTSSLPDGVVGYAYDAPLHAYGGLGSYVWSLNAGELPPGLTVSAGGSIVGTPTQAGTYQFIIRVDSGGQFDTQRYAVDIDSDTTPNGLTITTASIPSAVQGHWYGATLQAVGGVWPRRWNVSSGALPDGVSLDGGGTISGRPTVAGSFNFTARVVDRNGTLAIRALTLVVATETSVYYDIGGIVFDEGGNPLGGVVLRGLPNTPVTAADGTYSDRVPAGWSGTAIPFAAGHSFTPASRTYINVTADRSSQDYNVAGATLPVSGTVNLSGSGTPLAGVVMTGLPGNPSTDLSGAYSVTVNYGWSGTVTPVLAGYTFVPATVAYSNITLPQTTSYVATPITMPAARLAFTQNPGGGVGGAIWAVQPRVEIQDAAGNRIHGDDSTVIWLSILDNPGDGTLSGMASATAIDGEAVFSGLSIERGGQGYTLRASTAPPVTLIPATSASFGIEGFSYRASMNDERRWHTATFLYTDKILIAGGMDAAAFLRSAELYDPETDSFSVLPDMTEYRGGHTTTTLLDGKVLIVGGGMLAATAEIFDPATGTFTPTGSMTYGRQEHAASRLQDGRVLVSGGSSDHGETAEIFDPATGTWSLADTMQESRTDHTSVWLPNGQVLVTGGGAYVSSAELYDPATGTFTSIGAMEGGARFGHTATLLDNGTVLIAGGGNNTGDLDTAEIYDPATNTFRTVGPMNGSHSGHEAVLLRDGTVLIVGGGDPEIYDPETQTFRLTGPAYIASLSDLAAATTADGEVFVSGGYGEGASSGTEMWNPLFPFPTHVISGHVRYIGTGVPGVLISGFPGFPITDSGGYYEAVVLDGWDGDVTPIKPGYTFDPSGATYTDVSGDMTGQDYNVLSVPTFTISGSVNLSGGGPGVEGVAMNGLPGNPLTDSAGHYAAFVEEGWTGTVTPSKAGYTFTPAYREYAAPIKTDMADQDYAVAILSYTITASAGANGGISPSGDVPVNHGASQTFAISPETGYQVADVLVDGVSAGAVTTYTFTNVTAPHTIAASFSIMTYTLIVNATNGEVTKDPLLERYDYGSTVQLTATPADGYHFVEWTGDAGGSENPIMIVMDGDKVVTANFAHSSYSLTITKAGTGTGTVTSEPAGINCGTTCSASFEHGTVVTLTATPVVGSIFTSWSDDLVGTTSPAQITMDGVKNVTATFTGFTPVQITMTSIHSGIKGTAYSKALAATGGLAPYTWGISAGTLPTGVTLSADTGLLSGTPTESGAFSFTVRIDDSVLQTDMKDFTLVVAEWAASYSGPVTGTDRSYSLAVDAAGQAYITGYAYVAEFGNNHQDYATVKYAPAGSPLWDVTFNGTADLDDIAYSIAVDSTGNSYVAGKCDSDRFHVVKYDSSGIKAWDYTHMAPGILGGSASAIAVDSSGYVYVTGSIYGTALAFADVFTMKLDRMGQVIWSRTYGGTAASDDRSTSISIDMAGNTYVTGYCTEAGKSFDFVTIKYSPSGEELWVALYNGELDGVPVNGLDLARDIALDSSGNVYVTGSSERAAENTDYLTIKYDSNGNQLWRKRWDGPESAKDSSHAIVVDDAGNVYITGETQEASPGYNPDYFTIKYDSSGAKIWEARFDGDYTTGAIDSANDLIVDPVGNVYVVGKAQNLSSSWLCTAIKYDSSGVPIWVAQHTWGYQAELNAVAIDQQGNIFATGWSGNSGSEDYRTLKYTQSFPTTLIITTPWLDNGYVGTAYAKSLWAFGGSGTRTWSIISGTLPPGLSLDPGTGLIAGMPSTIGIYDFTVQVNDGILNSTKSLSIGITAGPPSRLAFGQQPSITTAGAIITPPVTVMIQDAAGNLVTTATNTVTLSLQNAGSAVLSGTLSKAAVGGIATFSDLSVDLVGTGYALRANSDSLTEVDSNAFNITVVLLPEISIRQNTTAIEDSGAYDFGSQVVGSNTDVVFTIENTGTSNLTITAPVTMTGANADQFSVIAQPSSPVAPSGSTTFTIRFSPTSLGVKYAAIAIANNDTDENPCDISLNGTAIADPFTKILSGDIVTDTGWSSGSAWGDYDNDGDLDLFVANGIGTSSGENNSLYTNNGDGTFTKITSGDVVMDGGWSSGSAWGDFDNDGDLDLFVANSGNNFLYMNNGDGTFAKVTSGAVVEDGGVSFSCSLGDYDNDGDLDLFVANSGNNFLYTNNGDGTFTKVTSGAVVQDGGTSHGCAWGDYDNDGDLDLFVANGKSTPPEESNFLYTNNGDGSFTKVTSGDVVTDVGFSLSCAWGDYDNDGDLDLFVGNSGNNYLYMNNGNGTFAKITSGVVVEDGGSSTACAWGDYDNDGDLDLFVANQGNNFLYMNNGNGTFAKITSGVVVEDAGISRGCAWGDYDNDGDLDLFVANLYGQNNLLYANNANSNNWLSLNCVGRTSNFSAIGAMVKVLATISGSPTLQLREISGGTGSQDSLNVEFGLGDATIVDEIRVEWPSGIVQTLTDIDVDQYLTVTEAEAYEFMAKWGSHGTGDGQFDYPVGIAADGSGYIYVVDNENARIQKFTSDGTFVTKWGSSGSGDGQFSNPWGIAVDGSGYVYVTESGNNRVQKFTSNGTYVTQWGSYGTGDGQFNYPWGIAVDGSGYVYVVDNENARIQKFTSDGTFVTKWGSSGSGDGQFSNPWGIAVDGSGYVYVTESGNNRVQKFTSDGTYVTQWGTYGTGDGQFDYPLGIAVGCTGLVFIVDNENARIQEFTSSGKLITQWGSSGPGDGEFSNPHMIAVDSLGCVFVTDTGADRVQKFRRQ